MADHSRQDPIAARLLGLIRIIQATNNGCDVENAAKERQFQGECTRSVDLVNMSDETALLLKHTLRLW